MDARLDPSKLGYKNSVDDARYRLPDVETCAQINRGTRFMVLLRLGGTLIQGPCQGNLGDLHYAFVVTATGSKLPFPQFERALGKTVLNAVAGEVGDTISPMGLEMWLRRHFGYQFVRLVLKQEPLGQTDYAEAQMIAADPMFVVVRNIVARIDALSGPNPWITVFFYNQKFGATPERMYEQIFEACPWKLDMLVGEDVVDELYRVATKAQKDWYWIGGAIKWLLGVESVHELLTAPTLASRMLLLQELAKLAGLRTENQFDALRITLPEE